MIRPSSTRRSGSWRGVRAPAGRKTRSDGRARCSPGGACDSERPYPADKASPCPPTHGVPSVDVILSVVVRIGVGAEESELAEAGAVRPHWGNWLGEGI